MRPWLGTTWLLESLPRSQPSDATKNSMHAKYANVLRIRTSCTGHYTFLPLCPPNAPAQPRRAHTLVNSTPHVPPAGGCSGLLAGKPPVPSPPTPTNTPQVQNADTGP